jgi:hypothetical protein
MQTLSSSRLSDFRTCPRLYYYRNILGRRTVSVAPTLAFGTLWHTVIEILWKGENVAEYLLAHAAEIDVQDAAKIKALLMRYSPPRDQFNVLATEQEFEVKIENPDGGRAFYGYRLTGKIDLVLRCKLTHRIWVCDHKTTSSEIIGFGQFWQVLTIDGQMNNYCMAIPALYGEDAAGFIYDVVRKPGIRLCGTDEKQATALGITPAEAYSLRCEVEIQKVPECTYQWRETPAVESDLLDARRDLWQQVEMVRQCDNAGRYPRNCNSCCGRYRTCEYLDVCTGRASIEDDSIFRNRQEEVVTE